MYIHLNKRYLCVCVDPRAQDRSVGFLQDMGRELHDEIEHMKSVMLDLEAVLTGVYVCVCVYVCERGRYGVRVYDGFSTFVMLDLEAVLTGVCVCGCAY